MQALTRQGQVSGTHKGPSPRKGVIGYISLFCMDLSVAPDYRSIELKQVRRSMGDVSQYSTLAGCG